MKVTETIKKEFTPYKMSIKVLGNKFVIEYYERELFVSVGYRDDFIVHKEEFKILDEAIRRFNEVIKEIG